MNNFTENILENHNLTVIPNKDKSETNQHGVSWHYFDIHHPVHGKVGGAEIIHSFRDPHSAEVFAIGIDKDLNTGEPIRMGKDSGFYDTMHKHNANLVGPSNLISMRGQVISHLRKKGLPVKYLYGTRITGAKTVSSSVPSKTTKKLRVKEFPTESHMLNLLSKKQSDTGFIDININTLYEDIIINLLNEGAQYLVHLGVKPIKETGSYAMWHLTKDQLGDIIKNPENLGWKHSYGTSSVRSTGYHDTARGRKVPPEPISYFVDKMGGNKGNKKVLYHGVGRDQQGAKKIGATHLYDPYHPDEKVREEPPGDMNQVHSHYTLNVVDKDNGLKILKHIHSKLNPQGTAVISVRRDLK
jgi:hypothetical protein